MSVKILVADDHPIVRKGLRDLLENEPLFQIVGEAGDGLQALELINQKKPDVIIVDMMMPGLNGLEVLRQAKQLLPKSQVIILSMHSNEAYVAEALKNGASGYILKDSGPVELILAVNEVIQGRRYLSAAISEEVVNAYIRKAVTSNIDPFTLLTNREREIMQLAAEGYTSQEIAQRLTISRRTVEQHRANLMEKLGLRNHSELIRYAFKRGMLPLDG
jgi:two-component system, NarL family, response regulator NreC